MKSIQAEDIIDLMFLPVTNIKVVEILDALGMNQPSLGEEYEMEGRISTEGKEMSGITICFEALDRNSKNGDPITKQIDFYEEHKVPFPLGLHKNDDYTTVVKKIGKKPDFCFTILETSKQWVLPYKDKEISYTVHFKEGLKSINTIVIGKFSRSVVEASEFIFPCDELEK